MPSRMITAVLVALLIPIPAIAQDINSELIEAAKNGDTVSINALLDAGADVNAKDVEGETALMWAARGGYTETAQSLLDAGADVNTKAREGTHSFRAGVSGVFKNWSGSATALLYATVIGHPEIVKILVQAGADVNQKDRNGTTLLTLATQAGHTEIVELLKKAGAKE